MRVGEIAGYWNYVGTLAEFPYQKCPGFDEIGSLSHPISSHILDPRTKTKTAVGEPFPIESTIGQEEQTSLVILLHQAV
jgi:hypothetical protein